MTQTNWISPLTLSQGVNYPQAEDWTVIAASEGAEPTVSWVQLVNAYELTVANPQKGQVFVLRRRKGEEKAFQLYEIKERTGEEGLAWFVLTNSLSYWTFRTTDGVIEYYRYWVAPDEWGYIQAIENPWTWQEHFARAVMSTGNSIALGVSWAIPEIRWPRHLEDSLVARTVFTVIAHLWRVQQSEQALQATLSSASERLNLLLTAEPPSCLVDVIRDAEGVSHSSKTNARRAAEELLELARLLGVTITEKHLKPVGERSKRR